TVPEGTGADPSTSHTFSNPGSYDVLLAVLDDNGAQGSDMVTIAVVPPAANAPPSADIIVLPASGVAPLRSILDASGSNDPDGVISEYSWDFDEGGAPFSSGTDPTINHEFSNPGTYNVTVTVTDNDGGTDSDSF